VSDELVETLPPREEALTVMRELDPNHFWTR